MKAHRLPIHNALVDATGCTVKSEIKLCASGVPIAVVTQQSRNNSTVAKRPSRRNAKGRACRPRTFCQLLSYRLPCPT